MVNNELMRVDVAIEIIAEMIADNLFEMKKEKNQDRLKELKEKDEKFEKEREQIYLGNKETINYVIEVYGSYLKEQR